MIVDIVRINTNREEDEEILDLVDEVDEDKLEEDDDEIVDDCNCDCECSSDTWVGEFFNPASETELGASLNELTVQAYSTILEEVDCIIGEVDELLENTNLGTNVKMDLINLKITALKLLTEF